MPAARQAPSKDTWAGGRASQRYRDGVQDIGRKIKGAVGEPALPVRDPSSLKRLLPWRLRLVLGVGGLVLSAGGVVVALIAFLVRRRLKR
jgi:hypothetical protein